MATSENGREELGNVPGSQQGCVGFTSAPLWVKQTPHESLYSDTKVSD